MFSRVLSFFIMTCILSNISVAYDKEDLKKLDVEIISPSSGVDRSIWEKIFKLLDRRSEIYTGSTEDQVFENQNLKFQKLDKALRSQHKILWALRGGYGVDKLMQNVAKSDYSKERKKVVVGYSDLTALLIHLSQKYGWVCISAPMLKDFVSNDKSNKSYSEILNLLNQKSGSFTYSDLIAINNASNKKKPISGKITGGNLTSIVATIGTPWQIDTNDKILLLEDVNVSGYHLDRLLTHLKNAGVLKGVRAIVFGDFGLEVSEVLKAFSEKLNVPVFRSTSFGHGKNNIPFGYNFNGTIESGKKLVMKCF